MGSLRISRKLTFSAGVGVSPNTYSQTDGGGHMVFNEAEAQSLTHVEPLGVDHDESR